MNSSFLSSSSSSSEEELINSSRKKDVIWDKYNDKPSRFKAVLIAASSNSTLDPEEWEEVLDEWELSQDTCSSSSQCICSQDIEYQYFMENKLTGRYAVVGSECIKKFGTIDQGMQVDIIRKNKEYEESGGKIMCCSCTMRRVSSEDQSAIPLCKSCRESGITEASKNYLNILGVLCRTCNVEKIVPGPIKTCNKCAEKDEDLMEEVRLITAIRSSRPCSSCLTGRIRGDRPRSWKQCWNCHKSGGKEVSSVPRVCVSCKKANISSSQPAYHTKCWSCYRSR